jgi:hypothetical protein
MPRVYVIFERDSDVSNSGRGVFIQNPDFDGDWEKRYLPQDVKPHRVSAVRIDGATGENGLFYNEELASSQGMSFMLIVEPKDDKDKIEAAKQKLLRDRDVVRFHILRLTEVLEWKDPAHGEEPPAAEAGH